MTRVAFIEDHPMFRHAISLILGSESGIEVVGEAETGGDAVTVAEQVQPDVLVLDVGLPGKDGISAATEVRERFPDIRILFLTMRDDTSSVRRAVEMGAEGYVIKTDPTEMFVEALRTVADGGTFFSPTVAGRVVGLITGRGGPLSELTDRELDILRLLATGNRPEAIAEKLGVSPKTVKNHLTGVYEALGVGSAAQAVAEAYRLGVVTLDDL